MTAGTQPKKPAFQDEDPAFSMGKIGPSHKLILNKFCVVRPQFVLHTIDFEPQSDALCSTDMAALQELLSSFGREYMIIFNCGADAGASVGHKHMQVLPRPDTTEHVLFPDTICNSQALQNVWQVAEVPFQHAVKRVPEKTDPKILQNIYEELRAALGLGEDAAHNFILVHDWMLVVPRTKARVDDMASNAAAMVGMVWVPSKENLEEWQNRGPMEVLKEVGMPFRKID